MKTEVPAGRVEVLGVYLEPSPAESIRVGSLLRDQAGTVTFLVDESYIALGPSRPLLSLGFHAIAGEEETIQRLRNQQDKRGSFTLLPAYFENLLPEGALHDVVERQLPPGENHEFGMLKRLGGDLPGAVVVREESPLPSGIPGPQRKLQTENQDGAPPLVKFSLAGVQMKFSMIGAGDRLTLPAKGGTGRVIVKLPSRDHPELPEIEFTAMMLAQAAGVTIAEVSLFPASAVEGIGSEFLKWGKNVLAVRRFDREDERRIHTEDFAQILGAIGNQKYRRANIETVVRLVTRFSSDPAASVLEMIRRIAVDLMLGNGDSHLKNTSFIYPDGRTPQLSPAYDIVPTVYFQPKDDLALAFGGKRSFERITFREFERMAGYVGVSAKVITKEVMRTVQRANDTWPEIIRSLSSPPSLQKTLSERWAKLALFKGEGNPFRK